VEELDFPVLESSAFKYVLKNTKVNLKHYQIKPNKGKKWIFKIVERLNYTKIRNEIDSDANSEEDICSRRSTIDFNDLEDDDEDDEEIDKQNPFLLGNNLEQENQEEVSENGMFLEESMNNAESDVMGLVVDDIVPQAKIVGFGDQLTKKEENNQD
jgi:hypothetical protein